jgi:hypothetical protein
MCLPPSFPPSPTCDVPGNFHTVKDEYNYHSFIVPAATTCTVDVIIYTGAESNIYGTNLYDLYMNGDPDVCPAGVPVEKPQEYPWDCNTFYDPYGSHYKTCTFWNLGPGTYYPMVDCYSPPGGEILCPGNYDIYVQSSDVGCPNIVTPSTSTTSTTTTSTTSTTIVTPMGMIARWSFEGSGQDSAGSADLNPQGAITYVPGKVGQAADFDGATTTFEAPAAVASLNLYGGNVTVLAWVKLKELKSIYRGVYTYGRGDGNSYTLYISDTNTIHERLCFTPNQFKNGAIPLAVDRWYLLATVWNTDDKIMRLYVDGQPDLTSPTSPTWDWGTGNPDKKPRIGSTPGGAGSEFINATIDEVRVYNIPLSQSEVYNIYAGEVGKADGESCTTSTECTSGSCAPDYDGSGRWCAPSGNCTHSGVATCDSTCYGYVKGEIAPDCGASTALRNCTGGSWTQLNCPVCGSRPPCIGRLGCQAGTPAACTGVCSTSSNPCDYCGNVTRGWYGSDTWYDATCDASGACVPSGQTDCLACQSCRIAAYAGSCDATGGVNAYLVTINDTTGPNVCTASQYCDGSGACMNPPITTCDSVPSFIEYGNGCIPASSLNCRDDGSGDGNAVRLTRREYYPGNPYPGGWKSTETQWRYTYRDDDEVSIGVTSPAYSYVKHGSSFRFNVSVGGESTLSIMFSVMPEGNCSMNVKLYDETGTTLLGQCPVGQANGAGSCMTPAGIIDPAKSRWQECQITLNAGFTNNAVNRFTVKYDTPIVGTTCGLNIPCVLFFDQIGISCV